MGTCGRPELSTMLWLTLLCSPSDLGLLRCFNSSTTSRLTMICVPASNDLFLGLTTAPTSHMIPAVPGFFFNATVFVRHIYRPTDNDATELGVQQSAWVGLMLWKTLRFGVHDERPITDSQAVLTHTARPLTDSCSDGVLPTAEQTNGTHKLSTY